jgi:type VI secretion system protein VasJ
LVAAGKRPISAEAPAGADPRQSAAFEELYSEAQRSLSATGGAADWDHIVRLSAEILSTQGKDLVVAGYLAIGLIHTQQVPGFVLGSTVVMDMIETHWDGLFPAKAKPWARSRAIDWWVERTATSLRGLGAVGFDGAQAEALTRRLDNVRRFLHAELGEGPSFAPILDWIARAAATVSPMDASSSAPVNGGSVPTASPSPAVEPAAAVSTEAQARQGIRRLAEQGTALASFFLSRDLADPAAYRLQRFALWFAINEPPPASEGRTPIAPPERHVRDRLLDLRKKGDLAALVRSAEDEARHYLYWFDLHRLSAEALEALGERFAAAARTVNRETASFVARLPGIEKRAFSDGTPFADDDTQRWLAVIDPSAPSAADTGPASKPATVPAEAAPPPDVEEIKRLLRSRKTAEAARLIQERLRASACGRDRFAFKLEFASLLMKHAGGAWVGAQAAQILEDIDRFRLDEFDPALALRGLAVALKAYRAGADPHSKRRAEEVLHRVAKIDLAEFVKQQE